MSFDSGVYLLFLPMVAAVHWLCPNRKRWIILLAASALFYMSWSVSLAGLLAGVAVSAWLGGLALSRWRKKGIRGFVLGISLGALLGVLGYFKYAAFLLQSVNHLLGLFGREGVLDGFHVILPVGISFYIFQAVSYVIDVYRDRLEPERHLGYLALYIAFFPQLVAGPIERAGDLLPQLHADRRLTREDLSMGARLLLSGFFRKVVVADFCGKFVNAVYSAPNPDGSAVFLGTVLFSGQIYCDFAGYSEIAAGSARLLGVRLMRNFNRPYAASSLREFWRRWHISLSRWFSDYIYIPLGGSRKGLRRQMAATGLVFLASGLWHGADWTFVVWGLLHGGLMMGEAVLEKAGLPRERTGWRKSVSVAGTFLLVSLCWIFFRSESLGQAVMLFGRLVSPWNLREGLALLGMTPADLARLGLTAGLLPMVNRLAYGGENPSDMTMVYCFLAIALAWLIRLGEGGANAFIYFQF